MKDPDLNVYHKVTAPLTPEILREINQEKEREQEERAKSEQSKHSNPIVAPERSDNQIFSPETAVGENHIIVPPKTSSVARGGNQVIVSDKPLVRETDVVDVIANKKSIHQDMGLSAIVLKPQPSSQSNGTKRSFTVPHTKRHAHSPVISSAVNRSSQVSTSSPLQDAAKATPSHKPVSKDTIHPESDNSTVLNSRIKDSKNSSHRSKNAQRNDSTSVPAGSSDKELDTLLHQNKKKDGDGGDVTASVRSGVSLLRMRGNIITFRKRVAEKAKSKKATPPNEMTKSDANNGSKVEDKTENNNVGDKDKVEEKLLDVPKVKMRFFNGTGKAI